MIVSMLTTKDNPFDPFDQFDQWFAYDTSHGYHTPSFLARMVISSDEISETDQALAINDAIDEIVKENITGNYMKVSRDSKE